MNREIPLDGCLDRKTVFTNGYARYNGLNDFHLRWIADANWTYTSDPIEGLYVYLYTSLWIGRLLNV